MGRTRLPIFYRHVLFAEGVSRLLGAHGFDIESIDSRQEDAMDQLRLMKPRLVLVEDEDDFDFSGTLSRIVAECPTVGIIRLSLQSNRIGLFSAWQSVATGAADLVAAFRLLEGNADEEAANPEGQETGPALAQSA